LERIQRIEQLLTDDDALSQYLDGLEKTELPVPERVMEGIHYRVQRKRRRLVLDIAKVAACLVLSLSVANAEFVISGEEGKLTEFTQEVEEKISDFYCNLTFGKDGFKGE